MAPEQASGAPIDERVDIYAVGVILYEMVVGRKPFLADSPMAVLRMHMDDPPLSPRLAAPDAQLSAGLEAVILRALEKEPGNRWPTAEAFARALEATTEGAASQIPALEPAGPAPRERRRRAPIGWLLSLAVAAALGALIGPRLVGAEPPAASLSAAVARTRGLWRSLITLEELPPPSWDAFRQLGEPLSEPPPAAELSCEEQQPLAEPALAVSR
jgi:hypothetical protein